MVARDVIAFRFMATIPGPRENDAEDVSLALEVAQTQWARGDHTEALKWLRKAADAAFDAEDDKRGIELSKVAAEVTAHMKNQKPKPPVPQGGAVPLKAQPQPPAPAAAPPRKTAPPGPPPRKTEPPAPPPRKPPSAPEPKARPKMDSTRRVAKNVAAARRSAPEDRFKATKPDAPPVDDDETTREYVLADMGPEASTGEEWPTESGDNLDELENAPEQTESRAVSRRGTDRHKGRKKTRTGEHRAAGAKRTRSESSSRDVPIPSTRAIRVAAGRDDKGRTYVRLLDSQGLRDGEHDTMLVALTSEADLRDLFRDE